MRLLSVTYVAVCAVAGFSASPALKTEDSARAAHALAVSPIRFEPNAGQMDARARFAARGLNYGFVFLSDRTLLSLMEDGASAHTVAMRFAGSDIRAAFEGLDPLDVRTNYFHGARKNWRTDVPSYGRLLRRNVYPGIDVVYYGNGRQLEYDFVVHPGADPTQIRLQFRGAERVRTSETGDLLLTVGGKDLVQRKPVIYQIASTGAKELVEGAYRIRGGEVRFTLAHYDRARALTVDPTLVYGGYLGGGQDEVPVGVAVDPKGLLYTAGSTFSTDFALNGDSYATTNAGDLDVFVAQVDPSNSNVIYASYIGGTSADTATAMAVDANGLIQVTGFTLSSDFPTPNGYQTTYSAAEDGFFFAIDPYQSGTNSMVYSTYFGGGYLDKPLGLALDGHGKAYITGRTTSPDFPVTGNALQSAQIAGDDAFLTVFDLTQAGSASLYYSTFFGGDRFDTGWSVAVDANGVVYLAGSTFSDDLPATGNAYDRAYNNGGDAFFAVIDISKSAPIQYCTYFGGSDLEEFLKVRVDSAGRVILAGYTASADMPVTANAAQAAFGGQADAIMAVFDITKPPAQQLLYSTYLGGSNPEVAMDFAEDAAGGIYVVGYTQSSDFPVTAGAMQATYGNGGGDAFLTRLDPNLTSGTLTYGSYIGGPGYSVAYGIAIGGNGDLYLAGSTTSTVLGGLNFGLRVAAVGNADVFLLQLHPDRPAPAAESVRLHRGADRGLRRR